jgi:catechol 2,3-dioxygenase-like lactoylglutathione lyase family enzyme
MIMEIMEVIPYVHDMQAQVGFYRDMLGLAVSYPKPLEDYHNETWVTLNSGAGTLALHSGGQRCLEKDTPMVVFRMADIQMARQALVERQALPADFPVPVHLQQDVEFQCYIGAES